MSRALLNVVLIGLVVLLLVIPVSIGLQKLERLQAEQPTVVQGSLALEPTAQVAAGDTGYASQAFSMSYPAQWKQSATSVQLRDGTLAHAVVFADGQNTSATVYTMNAASNQLQPHMDNAALLTAGSAPVSLVRSGIVQKYDGAEWTEDDYSWMGTVGTKSVPFSMRVLGGTGGILSYVIVLSAPSARMSQDSATIFSHMLATFRFN